MELRPDCLFAYVYACSDAYLQFPLERFHGLQAYAYVEVVDGCRFGSFEARIRLSAYAACLQ
jgi:hypothetical protein